MFCHAKCLQARLHSQAKLYAAYLAEHYQEEEAGGTPVAAAPENAEFENGHR
jgi:hypothetical protein